ncbi:MAG: energy-coupling factor ABC transporter ATP-binding protein [Spirochaetaceae bacterium]|jgi:energy-coupling factor transport system ATP-binding protein|nr:energy-coupling factor ABC transporter ATP-binding protein [Spirochaetaceae bacterium]
MKIEIKNLYHSYPTGDEALKGISFDMEGTIPVAIVGQNGSGKTTLVKHFNRILSPTRGTVLIDGKSTLEQSTAKWARRVGYVFQNPDDQLFLSTVKDELQFGPKRLGTDPARIEQLISEVAGLCGLQDKLMEHPFDLTAAEKKFCAIGSMMMMESDAIIFDEPTCGQDINGTNRLREIVDYLISRGKLCITISHDMKFVAEKFKRIIVLHEGEILLDGGREEVFSQPELLKSSFVSPPPITRVGQGIGIKETVFTVDNLIDAIKKEMA